MQDTKESVAHIQLCCRLKSLLQKKKMLKKGDTPESHAEKVWAIFLISLVNIFIECFSLFYIVCSLCTYKANISIYWNLYAYAFLLLYDFIYWIIYDPTTK